MSQLALSIPPLSIADWYARERWVDEKTRRRQCRGMVLTATGITCDQWRDTGKWPKDVQKPERARVEATFQLLSDRVAEINRVHRAYLEHWDAKQVELTNENDELSRELANRDWDLEVAMRDAERASDDWRTP